MFLFNSRIRKNIRQRMKKDITSIGKDTNLDISAANILMAPFPGFKPFPHDGKGRVFP